MVLYAYAKHYFSGFLRVGLRNVGQFFSGGFPNWIWGCHFAIVDEIQGPTGHRHGHIFTQFPI